MSKSYNDVFPVKVAFLHQTVQIPGVFGGEKTLSHARVPGIKLTYTPAGLIVEVKGMSGIVPLANVAIAVFEDESKAPTKALTGKEKGSTQIV